MERLWVPSLQSYLWLQVEISWSRPQCLRFRNEANAYDGCQSTEEFRAMPLFLHHLPIYITRRYKKFWEEPQASQTDTVSYNVDFLWSRSKASNIFSHRNHDLGSFQFSFQLSKTLETALFDATVPWEKSVQNQLKRLELFARELGSPWFCQWIEASAGDPIIQSLSSKTLLVASAKLPEIQNLVWIWQSSSLSSFRCSTQNLYLASSNEIIWNSIEATFMAGSLPRTCL